VEKKKEAGEEKNRDPQHKNLLLAAGKKKKPGSSELGPPKVSGPGVGGDHLFSGQKGTSGRLARGELVRSEGGVTSLGNWRRGGRREKGKGGGSWGGSGR